MSTQQQPKEPKRLRGAFRKEPVYIDDKDGNPVLFYVREFDGVARTDYMTWFRENAVENPDGKTMSLKSMKGLYEHLVVPCLFKSDLTKPDPGWVLHGIPDETLEELAAIARQVNRLGTGTEQEAEKNASSTPKTAPGGGSPSGSASAT